MKTYVKETNSVNVLAEYLDAGFSKKSYPAWVRKHFPQIIGNSPENASSKFTFFVQPKLMIDAVQNSQKFKINLEKREKWLSEAYNDMSAQFSLNFEKTFDISIMKKAFGLIHMLITFMHNDSGMGYSAMELLKQDIVKTNISLFESILGVIGVKPIHQYTSEAIRSNTVTLEAALKYLSTYHVPLTIELFYKSLNELCLCDSVGKGHGLSNSLVNSNNPLWVRIHIVDVYLLLISKLWK